MTLKPASSIVIAAFAGWSDTAEAATEVVDFLVEAWDAHVESELPADDYYDYTYNRPEVDVGEDGTREIIWPNTVIHHAQPAALGGKDVFLIVGDEPNRRWKRFCEEVAAVVRPDAGTILLTLGAIPAEVAHTRPVPVHGHTSDAGLREATGYDPSPYEGPIGITSILAAHFETLGVPHASLWAVLPHYAAMPPCPKGALALLRHVEDLLDTTFALQQVTEDARAWQATIDELVRDDEDLDVYVKQLEATADTVDVPEASGEAIAREFERYLKRRER